MRQELCLICCPAKKETSATRLDVEFVVLHVFEVTIFVVMFYSSMPSILNLYCICSYLCCKVLYSLSYLLRFICLEAYIQAVHNKARRMSLGSASDLHGNNWPLTSLSAILFPVVCCQPYYFLSVFSCFRALYCLCS